MSSLNPKLKNPKNQNVVNNFFLKIFQKVQLALEYYILSRYLEPLWMMGKITDKAFEYVQQKRYFYIFENIFQQFLLSETLA